MVLSFEGRAPLLGEDAWVAPTATVVGDVVMGEGASVWYGAVVRGDFMPVRIGRGTNIQDNAVVHVTTGRSPTTLGEGVTVGHGAVLHGCTVHDRVLVGIGAIVLDDAVIGEEAMVGAGALVTPGTHLPPRMLALGSPARPARPLTEAELAMLRASGPHYLDLSRRHRMSNAGVR
jgi:carbonic anhydrase/acetyltransferase-like protein (isoleucine patch superfamily)